ncbi:coproporphyrinogen-III oxidase family protein [Olsenella urininfantis]|uniref:coproporphyrinogen-III oxidase family protein n=1 Tax=Olsenella urininfantis TaxID=1871033 RepID=UPI001356682E|nr:coproporphyrinogen-III oxidase family protein [Olsenella urininfantis]
MSEADAPRGWPSRYERPDVESVYLHLPFCERKCLYCDFPSWTTRAHDPLMAEYSHALESQLRAFAGLGLVGRARTAYLGGGTPSMLGPDTLAHLVGELLAQSPAIEELSFEANPESLDAGLCSAAREAGATRVSMGVQSLDDEELSRLGRIHSARRALEAAQDALSSGLALSCDLMCAIPAQTSQSWRASLSSLLELGVAHLSVYPLAIEKGTKLERGLAEADPAWNSDEVQARRMLEAEGLLAARGLSRYEVASYARPGHECLHNQSYWTGQPYLGLGTGASSMLTRTGYLLLRDVCPQLPPPRPECSRVRLTVTSSRRQMALDPAPSSLSFDLEFLDRRQQMSEDLMLSARLTRGIDARLLDCARGVLGEGRVEAALGELLARGLATPLPDGGLAPSERGWLLGNELYGRLWGLSPSSPEPLHVQGV